MWESLEAGKKSNVPAAPKVVPADEAVGESVGGWGALAQPTKSDAAASPSPPSPFVGLVHRVLRQSMEEMMFLPVEEREMVVATLDVLEPMKGTIQFVMSRKQARDIAMAIHAGVADDLSDQMTMDAVAELINTVAGQLASSLLPADQTFALGLPAVELRSHVACSEPVRSAFMEVVGEIFQMALSGQELLAACDAVGVAQA